MDWVIVNMAENGGWSPSDVATVVIAFAALVVSVLSVWSTFAIHKRQGPIIEVETFYHAKLRKKAEYVKNLPPEQVVFDVEATTDLASAPTMPDQYSRDKYFYSLTFLRLVLTNKGRMDAAIESIFYFNTAGRGISVAHKDEEPYPLTIPAQTNRTRDFLYSSLADHAGTDKKVRFEVTLTNGTKIKVDWIHLDPALGKV